MQRNELFRQLRKILALLYGDIGRARALARDVGLDLSSISFSGSSLVFWDAILEAAEASGKVEILLGITCSEYPAQQALADLIEQYRAGVLEDAREPTEASNPTRGDPPIKAIDRGLGALLDLLQNADVRVIVAGFHADFLTASQQVNVLSDYKDLHDLLHDLQFQCYNPIASQADRFPEDELVVDTLMDHELTFKGLVVKLREIATRLTMSGELTWIAELVEAEAMLEQALETRDPETLKRHCRFVRRVLDRYPSLVNARLNAAARSLRMDAIERAMLSILEMLRYRVGASPEVPAFAVAVASLAELNERLTCLVRDHDRWQDVDVELRRVEATLNSDPEELEMSWPYIKARTVRLLCNEDEGQNRALSQDSIRLEEALRANDPENARRYFKRFQRQAAEHFYRVDTELKTLCGQMRTIGAPLGAVAELVATMSPPQPRSPR